jgi:polysaccharide export outer membrane protein
MVEVPEEPPMYQIGAGDTLTMFVWRNADLSTSVTVRPDGRISVPLIEDLYVEGKTPSQLSREIETKLAEYVQNPLVTVTVGGFVGTYPQQVRVVGQATQPMAIPYRANMTVLDAMIQAGGLTQFADGNKTTLVRVQDGAQKEYRVYLDDLLKDGDISANLPLLPGDILIVPETFF